MSRERNTKPPDSDGKVALLVPILHESIEQDTRQQCKLESLRLEEEEVSPTVDRLYEDDDNYVPSRGDDGDAIAFSAEHHLRRALVGIQAAIDNYEQMESIEELYND